VLAIGAVDTDRESAFEGAGPPSFARRFARICDRSSSATRFDGRRESSSTFSGSISCGAGGGGGDCSSAMLERCGVEVKLGLWVRRVY
jgi:hypothetical protein